MKLRFPEKSRGRNAIDWFSLFTEGQQLAFAYYFELLYPSHYHHVYKIIGDAAVARDIVIHAFAAAWRQRRSFSTAEEFRAFIVDDMRMACTSRRMSRIRDHKHANAGATEKYLLFAGWEQQVIDPDRLHKEILAEMLWQMHQQPRDRDSTQKTRALRALQAVLRDRTTEFNVHF